MVSGWSGTDILLNDVSHTTGIGCVTFVTMSTITSDTTATHIFVLVSGRSHAALMSPAEGMCAPMLPLCRNLHRHPFLWMFPPLLRVLPHHLLHRKKFVRHRNLNLRFLLLWYPLYGPLRKATGCARCAPVSVTIRHTPAWTHFVKENGIER